MTRMNTLTKLLCAVLVLCGLLCCAGAAGAEGDCAHIFEDGVCTTCGLTGGYCGAEGDGTNLVWTLNDGTFAITGTGAMADYDPFDDSPWYTYRNSITALTIQEGVTTIGRGAFYQTAGLKSVTIPASVTKLGYGAFVGSGLEAVTFADESQLTTIDYYAFQNCEALTEITLPAGVGSFWTDLVFYGCEALTDIHVAEGNTTYKGIDGVLYTADGTTLMFYPEGKTATSFTTPAGVTAIGQSAFSDNGNIESVTLSEGVTTIGDGAFSMCSSLQSVSLPSTLTSIGDSAFFGCNGLTTVTIPANVTSIGYSAFENCDELTTVTIPASVTSIGDFAFIYCNNLTTVNAPCSWDGSLYTFADTVTVNVPDHRWKDGVCGGCGAICPHTFTDGVCTVCGLTGGYCGASTNEGGEQSVTWTLADNHLVISGEGAMVDSYYGDLPWWDAYQTITDVTIGEGVTRIGKHAFFDFQSLTEITIPASVESIGYEAFGNSTVSSVTFAPNSRLTTIDGYAFSYLGSLKQITLPASVETIGAGAFESCTALETVTFAEGSRLSSLGYMPFFSCNSLTAISIPESVTAYKTIDGVLYSGDGTTLLLYPAGKTDEAFTTPAGVTTIAELAFFNTQLHNITLSEGVTTIGNSAFLGCSSMQSVSLPSTLTSIGEYAFANCGGLTTITIPASVSSIGDSAFDSCSSLAEVTIPASVTSIGEYAFEGCDALTTVNAPCSWDGSLYTFADTVTVNVPDHAFVDGVCTGCGAVCEHPGYEDGVCTQCGAICAHAFEDGVCTTCGLTGGYCGASTNEGGEQSVTWTLADNHLVISGTGAMADYSSSGWPWNDARQIITDVTIGEGVTHIGKYALYYFRSLTEITIPASVEFIGYGAFQNSTVSSVTFAPNSRLTTIDAYAFSYLHSLKQITLPASVESIGEGAFASCIALETVTFAEGSRLSSLGYMPFSDCNSLTAISIPESVTAYKTIDSVLYSGDGTTLLLYPAGKTDEAFTTPAGVTTIAEGALSYARFRTVILSEGVTTIGNGAFSGCSDMQSVSLPSTLTSIDDFAFFFCNGLTTVTIPANVTSIGNSAFENCDSLTEVTIPASVTSIGSNAFAYCNSLTTVNAPCSWDGSLYTFADTVTVVVADHAFADGECTGCGVTGGYCGASTNAGGVQSVVWTYRDGTLTITGNGAMADYDSYDDSPGYTYRNSITALTIQEGVTTIGRNAFHQTAGLKSVTIPASVTKLGYCAFAGSGLEAVTFADESQLTTIDRYAFQLCDELTEITLPAGVGSFRPDLVFYGCSALTDIHVAEGNTTYKGIDGVLYTADGTTLMFYPEGKTETSFTTPAGVTTIGQAAFSYKDNIKSVTLSEGVTTIGKQAFLFCGALAEVTIPASVTSIGTDAFYGCDALTTAVVPCVWMETPLYTFGGGVTLDYAPHDYDEGGVCTLCGYAAKASIGRDADVLYFDTLPDALAAVEPEDIINVLADCDEDITIPGECKWYGSDFTCSGTVVNNSIIYEGVFTGHVTNSNAIVGGTFDGEVTNQQIICGGTFNNAVTNDGHLSSGEFNGVLTNNATIDNVAGVSWFTIGDDFVLINNGTLTCESHIDPTVANCQHGETCRLCGEYGQKDPANHTYASNVCCGVCGENLRWTLTDGTLAITGTGEMPESASASDVPWYDVREAITSVQLPDGLETIASYAFDGCSAMTSINIPLSVTYIGNGAFNGCTALTTVNVPCTWMNSWLYAFENGDVLQIGDHQSIEIVWEWREDSAYAYAYKHCTDCDTYTDSTDGDAEVTETEAGDCAHPGSRVFTATLTFSDSTVVTGTHTVVIPSENHVGPMNNGFCAACGSAEKPAVDPGEYEDETWDDTYLISNAGQLYWFANEVNGGNNGIGARLMANITVPASVSKGGSIPDWEPIGQGWTPYCGDFNGGGHTISGLYCVSSRAGLFGYTDYYYNIRNIGVVNGTFIGSDYAGALVGYASSNISGCWASGNTIEGNYAGGLVGQNIGTITGSRATGNTVEGSLAGGLVGYNNNGTIGRSYGTGNTLTGDSAGGLIGENYGTVENCYATGNTSGYLVGYSGGPITNCFTDGSALFRDSYGDVTNSYYVAVAATDDGGRTAAQFASGEIAWLLQSAIEPEEVWDEETGEWVMADAALIWGQSIGSASYPALGGKRVYQVLSCDGEGTAYSNTDEQQKHSFTDSVCVNCGAIGGFCGAEGDGTHIAWTLKDGTLTITGTGDMAEYDSYEDSPWYTYRNSITALTIQEGVTTIGGFAFPRTAGLKSVIIPATVKELGNNSFASCEALETVTFAEDSQLTTIGIRAFDNCSSLTEITLPEDVRAFDVDSVFGGCTALTNIFVAKNNETYKDIDGVLYTADGTTLMYYPEGKAAESFTTPDGVTTIADDAFYANNYLKTVTVSEGVTSIGLWAFGHCGNLETVNLPDSLTSIGWYAFDSCYALTTVTIPDGVESIGDNAFQHCTALTTVTIPVSVESIGADAFFYCDALTTVNVPCNWDGSLYTFEDTVTVNLADHSWTDGVCGGCGMTCPHDTGNGGICSICGETVERSMVILPVSLTAVEAEAFTDTAVEAVVIPAGCTSIAAGAFSGCGSLKVIIFTSADCTIGDGAIPAGTAIIAPVNGTVENWAESNGLTFLAR